MFAGPAPSGWINEIDPYLPVSFANPDEKIYIHSLKETFELNYSNQKFGFAHFAFHLIYMSFAAFTVWKIFKTRETDFKKGLIGFTRDRENCILRSNSPFSLLENIRETNLFRFLKLIGCENAHISGFAQFSNRRNRIVHPKGSLFINHPKMLDWHLSQIVQEVHNIQGHMHPLIEEMFHQHSNRESRSDCHREEPTRRSRDNLSSDFVPCKGRSSLSGLLHSVRNDDMEEFIQQNYLSAQDVETVSINN